MSEPAEILRVMDGRFSFIEPVVEPQFDPRAGRARVFEAGQGPPVVVLHGWGGRIESMGPVIECLSASFRVLAFDLPGFGESPIPEVPWGTREYARFVAGASRQLGVERAGYVGHSFGAKTALYLAAIDPGRVDKLVLQGSSGLRSAASLAVRAKRTLSRGARAAAYLGAPGRALRDAIYERVASRDYQDAGALRPIFVRVVNEDLTDLLPHVRCSTLLVWGTNDTAVPLAHAHAMEKLIPDAGLVLFEGAGHFAYLEEPQRFCRIVSHFLGAPVD